MISSRGSPRFIPSSSPSSRAPPPPSSAARCTRRSTPSSRCSGALRPSRVNMRDNRTPRPRRVHTARSSVFPGSTSRRTRRRRARARAARLSGEGGRHRSRHPRRARRPRRVFVPRRPEGWIQRRARRASLRGGVTRTRRSRGGVRRRQPRVRRDVRRGWFRFVRVPRDGEPGGGTAARWLACAEAAVALADPGSPGGAACRALAWSACDPAAGTARFTRDSGGGDAARARRRRGCPSRPPTSNGVKSRRG